MIQITSRLLVRPEHRDQALELARQHVARSRQEPGCVEHNVLLDPDDPNALFFFERWENEAAIAEHFGREHSRELVRQMSEWSAAPATLKIAAIVKEEERPVGRP